MKWLNSLPKALVVVVAGFLVLAFVGTSYFVGSRSLNSKSHGSNSCPYTQDEMERIVEKYNVPEPYISPETQALMGAPAPIDSEAISNLKGECADVALEKAYEIGMRSLRDLSDCWDDCVVTEDYSETRLNYAIKNHRMVYISNG